ncbi:MAG: peptidoglycan-binding protein [Acidobacteriota bacterium]
MRSFRTRVLSLAALTILLSPLLSLNSSLTLADHLLSTGVIVPLRMNTSLSSETASIGQKWIATVSQDVYAGNQLVIPRGSTVEGHVTNVRDADRFNRSGLLGIDFDRIIFPNGERIENIDAMLTSLDTRVRAHIDEESRLRGGGSSFKRNVYFIGGGAGAGALIGALVEGGEGAGVGAGVGAIAGLIATALSKGREVVVPAGTEFGMELVSPLNVPVFFQDSTTTLPGTTRTTVTTRTFTTTYITDLNSRNTIQLLQQRLRTLGYYRGAINGVFTWSTRQALESFQDDHNLPETGRLDARTAELLGLSISTVGNVDLNSRVAISRAQQRLRNLGYYRGPINGMLTITTRRALREFQDDNQLVETGRLDVATARELGLSFGTIPGRDDIARNEDIDANGQPTFMGVGSTHRFIIWRDGNQWHVRTTTAGRLHNFQGRIVANNGSIRSVSDVGLEASDDLDITLERGNRALSFDFQTAGNMDGIDFYSDADTLSFDLRMDGRYTAQNIYIGRNGVNPVSLPFTLVNE